jgi:Tfp pilus assembly protein PilW
MELIIGLLSTLVVGLAIGVPVIAIRHLRDTSAAMLQAPDDLRRADDGAEPNAARGPGLGPLWPTD